MSVAIQDRPIVTISEAGDREYNLYDHQELALEWARKYPITVLSGGIQNGKTSWLLACLIQFITVVNPAPPAHVERHLWIVLPDRKKYWEPIKPKIEYMFGWASEGGFILERNLSKPSYTLKAQDGGQPWELFIVSANDPDTLRSATVCAAGVTEAGLLPEEAFDNIQGRVAKRAGPLFLDTSPFGINWFFRRVISKASVIADYDTTPPKIERDPAGDERIAVVHGVRTDANKSMPQGVIANMRKNASANMSKREYDGKFFAWTGLVWNSFRPMPYPDGHLVDPITVDDLLKSKTPCDIIGGLDFGYGHPTAHLWIVTFGRGRYQVVEEYRESMRTLKVHTDAIRANPWSKHLRYRYGDQSGLGAQAMAEVREYGMEVEPSCKEPGSVDLSCNRIQQLFESKRLLIGKNCKRLIDEIGAYHRDEKTGKVVDVQDDLCAALRMSIYTHSNQQDLRPLPFGTETKSGGFHVQGDDEELRDEWEELHGSSDEHSAGGQIQEIV